MASCDSVWYTIIIPPKRMFHRPSGVTAGRLQLSLPLSTFVLEATSYSIRESEMARNEKAKQKRRRRDVPMNKEEKVTKSNLVITSKSS
jgi:hypothetical protein